MNLKYSVPAVVLCILFAYLASCKNSEPANLNKEILTMTKRIINPWTWQDSRGFVQGNEITNANRILYTAGIVSVDADGNLLHSGDMEKQINKILDNMEVLLEQSDFELSDVVRFTYYTTDIPEFTKAAQNILIERLQKANCKPATSLIGVNALFHPECVVEIEATVIG